MKIILVSFSTLPSLQNYLYNSYEELIKGEENVKTIGSSKLVISKKMNEKNNVLIKTSERPGFSLNTWLYLPRAIRIINKMIKEFNPDIIHFTSKHIWNFILIKYIKFYYKNVKIVHTMHDPIGHVEEKISKKVFYYNRKIADIVDCIIVHSKKSYSEVEKHFKPTIPVVEAPLGEMKWKSYKEPYCTKKLLVFGRMNPYKGCELLTDMVNQIYKYDSEIKINIAGKFSDEVDERIVKQLNKCKNVEVNNNFIAEKEVENYFYNADLVLITHKSITQSGVILQAFRHSRAIVAFDIEGMNEFVVKEMTGVSVEHFNIQKYVKEIIEILNDKTKLKKMSYEAWKFGSQKFSTSKMCSKFIEAYKFINESRR